MMARRSAAAKQRRTAARPPRGRPFPPGVSGNPKGRPPVGKALAEQIRAIGDEVVDKRVGWTRLEVVLRRLYSDAMAGRHGATQILLDRGWGRPLPADTERWRDPG